MGAMHGVLVGLLERLGREYGAVGQKIDLIVPLNVWRAVASSNAVPAGPVEEAHAGWTAIVWPFPQTADDRERLLDHLRGREGVSKGYRSDLLTEEQLCQALHVSRRSVWKFRTDRDNPLPFMRLGGKHVYDLEEVRAWAKRRAQIRPARRKVRRRLPPI